MKQLREIIHEAEKEKVAIGHFNVSEFAALRAILRASRELDVPVIIGTSEGEAAFIGIEVAAALIRTLREGGRRNLYLNADHFRTVDKAKEAADAGYDSVIFDAAGAPFAENIRLTREAVDAVKHINRDILVEGELGYIGTSSELLEDVPRGAAIKEEDMTTPEAAAEFVRKTGVDLLAPAVGEIHGLMKHASHPRLDIDRIRAIRKAAGVPLVLHGGSGVSDEDFIAAIDAGISVIHINTELRVAWRRGLEQGLRDAPDEVAPYKILSDPEGKFSDPEEEVYAVVLKRLKLFSRLL